MLLFGLLFFLLTISIVLPLKWSRTILIAERYTYLPYIGLTLPVIYYLQSLYERSEKKIRILLIALAVMVCSVFTFQTIARNHVWKNPFTLFTDVVVKKRSAAEVAMGHFNRGNEYLRLQQLPEAAADYTRALESDPSYAEAYFNRGLTMYYQANLPEAIDDFSKTIRLKPAHLDAFVNRGIAYRAMGDYERALEDFNHVIAIQPAAGNAYFNRGVLFYFNLGKPEQACSDWQKALELGIGQAEEILRQYCR
jgi:tetratricopeptide (TPR) repeat protein